MTKSEPIERIVTHQGLLSSARMWSSAIKTMLGAETSQCLATGDRIDIADLSLCCYRAPRVGRNPKTGSW